MPEGEDNLVYKAAKLILDAAAKRAKNEIPNPKKKSQTNYKLTKNKFQMQNKERRIPRTEKAEQGNQINADEEYAGGDRTGVGKQ